MRQIMHRQHDLELHSALRCVLNLPSDQRVVVSNVRVAASVAGATAVLVDQRKPAEVSAAYGRAMRRPSAGLWRTALRRC